MEQGKPQQAELLHKQRAIQALKAGTLGYKTGRPG
jgi:hypothetical protein